MKLSMKRILLLFLSLWILLLPALMQLTADAADDEIKIYFQGKQITADVSPYIENDRTMVPVRMITEKMGYDVLWNPVSRLVTIYSAYKRVLLTIDNNIARVGDDTVRMDTPAVIRQSRTFVPIRFVSETFGYHVDWDPDTRSVLITKPISTPAPSPTPKATPKPTKTPAPTDANHSVYGTVTDADDIIIDKIFTERTTNKLFIKIQAVNGRIQSPKTMTLENPLRYVIDIPDAILQTSAREVNVGSEYISKVRFSQFTSAPNSVRIVVDMNQKIDISHEYIDGFFTLSMKDSPSSIQKITAAWGGKSELVTITSNTVLSPEYFVLYNPYRIVFDFYNTACTAKSISYKGSVIEEIRFYEHPEKTRVTITAKEGAAYSYQANGTEFIISVTPPSASATPSPGSTTGKDKKSKLIVLDPGHGGTEPGALGQLDGNVVIQEKELNLKISNKVLKILKDKGYNVIATRTTDTYVGLSTRAEIANSSNADLFVSIHNNSSETSEAQGTLTMYAYDDPKENQNISGKTIAAIMQKELVKGTGGYDRGLLKNPQIVVIRKTKMPAILTECLFLSNSQDLSELLKESRLDSIAGHIAQGIENIIAKMIETDQKAASSAGR